MITRTRGAAVAALVSLAMLSDATAGNMFVTMYAQDGGGNEALENASLLSGIGGGELLPETGFGDAAFVPDEDGAEYKINVLNYNLVLGGGGDRAIPLQVYYGESVSDQDDAKEENTNTLLDPTQGIAVQFPFVHRFEWTDGLCDFGGLGGHCLTGLDVTVRSVEIEADDGESGTSKKKIFGASLGARASMLLPIRRLFTGESGGYLGIGVGARLYHHQKGGQAIHLDPSVGAESSIGKNIGALTAEVELSLVRLVRMRFEYFSPLSDGDVLGKTTKFSVVMAP